MLQGLPHDGREGQNMEEELFQYIKQVKDEGFMLCCVL